MPAGRPLKFKTVEDLDVKVQEYFDDCDPHIADVVILVDILDAKGKRTGKTKEKIVQHITKQKPYTVTGLAVHLDTSRETLLDYEDKEEYSDTIKKAKAKIHAFAESRLFDSNPAGVIFNLKNNFGWRDKTEVDNTIKGTIASVPDEKMAEDFADYLRNKE